MIQAAAKRSPLVKERGMNGVLLSFLLGCAGAAAIFLPFVVIDKGFYLYAGDYNAQQVPFYYYLQGFIKNGGGTWSWADDIGTSAINAYSFYNLGSPFMWLTLLLPQRAMPYAMVPMFILKFGCIGAAAYLWLRRYAKTRNMAVICAMVYAFCGFNTYNIFFNHMLEPVIFFPLMLWALDGFMYDNRRGVFALVVGLALINSYFFFMGNVVFLLIYFFVKLATKEYKITLAKFLQLGLEAVLGVGIGMVLFMPSLLSLLGNPRTSEHSNGMNLVLYSRSQRYLATLVYILFPQDPPWMPNIFQDASIKWTSLSAYLPLLSVSGVVAYCKARKRSAIKWILGISFVCACVPLLNSSFYAFQTSISHYARWYYMPILIMVLATLRSLEDADIDIVGGAKFTLILMGIVALLGLVPSEEDGGWVFGIAEYASKFWLMILVGALGVFIFFVIVKYYRGKVRFAPILLSAVMGFSVVYSVVHLSLGKFAVWTSGEDYGYKATMYDSTKEWPLETDSFYRLDAYEMQDNLGLWTNTSTIQTFNSVITNAAREFYTALGLVRDVRSNPDVNLYALRGLLSVRYTVMPTNRQNSFLDGGDHPFADEGWSFYMEHEALVIYENDNFIPLGFTYDDYLNISYLPEISNKDARANLLVRAIGLTELQIAQYGHLFDSAGGDGAIKRIEDVDDEGNVSTRYEYDAVSYAAYVEDAAARRATASYYTEHDASGFTAKIELPRENLVFFSVPYDEGFSATVNGERAEILKVSSGLMAVYAPAGDNEIVFTYKTPGFQFGVSLTVLSLSGLVLYLAVCRYMEVKKADDAAKAARAAKKPKGKKKTGAKK